MGSSTDFRALYRWHLKKLARRSVAVGSTAVATLMKEDRHAAPCVRALTYHRFGDISKDPFCVSLRDFEEHMKLISAEQRAVSLDQVLAFTEGKSELAPDSCLVTIDDGMISTLRGALPILEKYAVPAVAFVSSKIIGLDLPDAEERYMTWPELQELGGSGLVTIGSHAHTHRSMGSLSVEEMGYEAATSRQLLSDKLNQAVTSFAYPFGMSRDFNDATDAALRESGYDIAFNSMHGPIRAGMEPVSLPRVKIEGGESCEMFASISRGALDAWRMIDDRLWRMQRVRREIS